MKLWIFLSALFCILKCPAKRNKVVYAFAPDWLSSNHRGYDWERLSHLCLFGRLKPILREGRDTATALEPAIRDAALDLVRVAHEHGVLVDIAVSADASRIADISYRDEWTDAAVQLLQVVGADGLNIDFESPIAADDTAAIEDLTTIVHMLRIALDHSSTKYGKRLGLSFDAAWAPIGVDGRHYDLRAIASIVDFLFVMAYDIRSQSHGPPCWAGPNSPLDAVDGALLLYLRQLGVPPDQLVLGVPWYGYKYRCLGSSANASPEQLVQLRNAKQDSSVAYCSLKGEPLGMQNGLPSSAEPGLPSAKVDSKLPGVDRALAPNRVHVGPTQEGVFIPALVQPKGACRVPAVPFDGAPCSDAAGEQVTVRDVYMRLLPLSSSGVQRDARAASPYFSYEEGLQCHQVWFDDVVSLRMKYRLARGLGLYGVGFWNIDCLPYGDNTNEAILRDSMFQALDEFLID